MNLKDAEAKGTPGEWNVASKDGENALHIGSFVNGVGSSIAKVPADETGIQDAALICHYRKHHTPLVEVVSDLLITLNEAGVDALCMIRAETELAAAQKVEVPE